MILAKTGRNLLHSFISVSSFMYSYLLDYSLQSGIKFYALGKRMTELMREHCHGGLSWVSNRFVEKGMEIPPPLLEPPAEQVGSGPAIGYGHEDPERPRPRGQVVKVYDANAVSRCPIQASAQSPTRSRCMGAQCGQKSTMGAP
jgi:hypothetical protein